MKIEGTFHDKTTTPECSENRTAVPSMTESELYVCTQCVSTVHTHSLKGLQSLVTKLKNTEYTSIAWEHPEIFFFYVAQNPSIGHSKANTTHFDRTALQQRCQQFQLIHLFNTAVASNQCWLAHRLLIYLFVYQPTHTTLGLTRARNETSRVGGVEGPTLGSWVTHPLSVLPSVPTSHPCMKQTPGTMQTMH